MSLVFFLSSKHSRNDAYCSLLNPTANQNIHSDLDTYSSVVVTDVAFWDLLHRILEHKNVNIPFDRE